jgi:hypothetical protein
MDQQPPLFMAFGDGQLDPHLFQQALHPPVPAVDSFTAACARLFGTDRESPQLA